MTAEEKNCNLRRRIKSTFASSPSQTPLVVNPFWQIVLLSAALREVMLTEEAEKERKRRREREKEERKGEKGSEKEKEGNRENEKERKGEKGREKRRRKRAREKRISQPGHAHLWAVHYPPPPPPPGTVAPLSVSPSLTLIIIHCRGSLIRSHLRPLSLIAGRLLPADSVAH